MPLKEEFKAMIFSLKQNKTLGPDGFMAGFYHNYLGIMRSDIMALIEDIFHGKRSLQHINTTFITLILKIKEATNIQDYRPISYVNTIYKVVSKLLDNRILEVIPELLSHN